MTGLRGLVRFAGWVCLASLCVAQSGLQEADLQNKLATIQREGIGVELAVGGRLVVRLKQSNGRSVPTLTIVRLKSTLTLPRALRGVFDARDASFSGLRPGEYIVEVEADGFHPAKKEATVFLDGVSQVYVVMTPGNGEEDADTSKRPMAPALAPKPRKELEAGIAALRAHQMPEAWKQIESALKHAPTHPDPHYIAALYHLSAKEDDSARTDLDSAIQLFPQHTLALTSLGELLLRQNKVSDAIPHLEKAVTVDPDAWRSHWLLSEAFLRATPTPDLKAAKFHASRAVALGKDPNPAKATLARAEALVASSEPAASATDAAAAGDAAGPAASNTAPTVSAAGATSAPEIPVDATADLAPVMLPSSLLARWPRDIDAAIPATEDQSSCSLDHVLEGSGRRATQFTDALERFSATEKIEQEEMDITGATRHTAQHNFDYSAVLDHFSADGFSIDELRNGSYASPAGFPMALAAKGVPAIGVLFLPSYAKDFQFTCEGLGQYHGQPAWQVRFEQRQDRPARMYNWVIDKHTYAAQLKGRAWISTGSFYLLRIETDLATPIAPIRLDMHHMAIDYAPVQSANGKLQLWLPATAEVHSHFKGHFIRERHDFSAFTLFSVDSAQNDKMPVVDPKPQ